MICPACLLLVSWGDFKSNKEMMKRLSHNLSGYKRNKAMGIDQIEFGTLIVTKPDKSSLDLAVSIANDLGPLVADMILELKINFFGMIIYKKTQYATVNHIIKQKSISLIATLHDILQAKPINIMAIKKCVHFKENIISKCLRRLKRQEETIKN